MRINTSTAGKFSSKHKINSPVLKIPVKSLLIEGILPKRWYGIKVISKDKDVWDSLFHWSGCQISSIKKKREINTKDQIYLLFHISFLSIFVLLNLPGITWNFKIIHTQYSYIYSPPLSLYLSLSIYSS